MRSSGSSAEFRQCICSELAIALQRGAGDAVRSKDSRRGRVLLLKLVVSWSLQWSWPVGTGQDRMAEK